MGSGKSAQQSSDMANCDTVALLKGSNTPRSKPARVYADVPELCESRAPWRQQRAHRALATVAEAMRRPLRTMQW